TRWLDFAIKAKKPVILMKYKKGNKKYTATGFMISNRHFMTNNHVINQKGVTGKIIFHYEKGIESSEWLEIDFDSNNIISTDKDLDFTICELDNEVSDIDYINIFNTRDTINKDEIVNLIGHPN